VEFLPTFLPRSLLSAGAHVDSVDDDAYQHGSKEQVQDDNRGERRQERPLVAASVPPVAGEVGLACLRSVHHHISHDKESEQHHHGYEAYHSTYYSSMALVLLAGVSEVQELRNTRDHQHNTLHYQPDWDGLVNPALLDVQRTNRDQRYSEHHLHHKENDGDGRVSCAGHPSPQTLFCTMLRHPDPSLQSIQFVN